jgi:polyisoprenoid-binding protein YceI
MARAIVMLLLLCVAGWPAPATAQGVYALDPRYARIGFSVSHMGLFSSEGQFARFDSQLTIDPAHPERTQIMVRIDADSVVMASEEGVAMLRSPAYFDVAHYPAIRFRSTAVEPEAGDSYAILGEVELRGITRPMRLAARLVNRQRDAVGEIVDFQVSGILHRAEFGMLADTSFIADEIALNIVARLRLRATAPGG